MEKTSGSTLIQDDWIRTGLQLIEEVDKKSPRGRITLLGQEKADM